MSDSSSDYALPEYTVDPALTLEQVRTIMARVKMQHERTNELIQALWTTLAGLRRIHDWRIYEGDNFLCSTFTLGLPDPLGDLNYAVFDSVLAYNGPDTQEGVEAQEVEKAENLDDYLGNEYDIAWHTREFLGVMYKALVKREVELRFGLQPPEPPADAKNDDEPPSPPLKGLP